MRYEREVRAMLDELGIPAWYGRDPFLPECPEAAELVPVGRDMFGREQRLTPRAAEAWAAMREAAARDGIVLQLVSAFRTVEYQRGIIERKVAAGIPMDEILRVSAAPGYSEHHTGRAIDISTPGSDPLEEEFEHTDAFRWLVGNAERFGFALSYPRDNVYGIIYEPWHWTFSI
ncbi:MAG TPA: M15 family metallopeptidase [Longimicrobium sp.]|jgi:D-alanyl-D-alanine carboxypeptidase